MVLVCCQYEETVDKPSFNTAHVATASMIHRHCQLMVCDPFHAGTDGMLSYCISFSMVQ